MINPAVVKKLIYHIDVNIICSAFLCTIVFTVLYSFLDDSHFGGLTRISKHLTDVHRSITRTYHPKRRVSYPGNVKPDPEGFQGNIDKVLKFKSGDTQHDSDGTDGEPDNGLNIEEDEIELTSTFKSILSRVTNRLYFAIVTGSTVGFGDIYPKSWIAKLLAGVQIAVMFTLLLKS